MGLILLIVIGGVLYVGLMYLRTFQRMVDELREMRFKCIKSGSDVGGGSVTDSASASVSASPLSNGELKNSFVSMLSYLKEQASP